jgi:glycosyltransferase involved in cell wall biosynthesis
MIEEKLEIVLITYNRASYLEHTLKEVLNSPFAACKITILDNHSSDDTPAVCAKYQRLYSRMDVKRHRRNIGGNPNILRAVETSQSPYTWILCDDDEYDFSDCEDVIKAIDSEKFDLISIGAPGQEDWERGLETTSQKLVHMGSKYFHIFTFVPGFIYRTDLYDSLCIHEGYFNIHNIYPHFPFINKSFEENFRVYVSKKDIILRGIENDGGYFTVLFWFKSWINCCSKIKDKNVRRKTIYESPVDDISIVKRLVYFITKEKLNAKDSRNMLDFITAFVMAFGYSRDQFLLLLIVPLVLIPSFFYKILIKIYLSLNKDLDKKSVMMDEVDPFRRW